MTFDVHGDAVRQPAGVMIRLSVMGFEKPRDPDAFVYSGVFPFRGNLDLQARELEAQIVQLIIDERGLELPEEVRERMRLALGEALWKGARYDREIRRL